MPKKQVYNLPIPKPPGLDLSEPKTLSGAKGIATRKNNAFRKMVESKFPLFAQELFSGYETITPEKVIENRRVQREIWKERKTGIVRLQLEQIKKCRAEVYELAESETEFFFLMRIVTTIRGGNRSMRWYRVLDLIKRRRSKPISLNADLVLAWISEETAPVTHFDLWKKRGDGLEPKEILNALCELMSLALVSKIDVINLPEEFCDLDNWKCSTAWTWKTF